MRVEPEQLRLSFHELSKSSCIVCGGSPIASIEIAGARSTSVRLCETCSARDQASRNAGTWIIRVAMLAVLIVGAAVATLDPQSRRLWTFIAWFVSAIVGFVSIRRVRDLRLALAPYVVIAIDDHRATFEIRRLLAVVGDAAYRSANSPRGAALRRRIPAAGHSIAWFTFPVIVGGLLAGVAWRGANPVVLIHNPDASAHTVRIDGADIVMREATHRWFRVHFGAHYIQIDGQAPVTLQLGWNADHVFAVTGDGCYADDVRTDGASVSFRGTSYSSGHAFHAYRGHWIRVPNARRTYPITCRQE